MAASLLRQITWPGGPCGPVAPRGPAGPAGPGTPAHRAPAGPAAPVAPGGPQVRAGPGGPVARRGARSGQLEHDRAAMSRRLRRCSDAAACALGDRERTAPAPSRSARVRAAAPVQPSPLIVNSSSATPVSGRRRDVRPLVAGVGERHRVRQRTASRPAARRSRRCPGAAVSARRGESSAAPTRRRRSGLALRDIRRVAAIEVGHGERPRRGTHEGSADRRATTVGSKLPDTVSAQASPDDPRFVEIDGAQAARSTSPSASKSPLRRPCREHRPW